MAAEHHVVEDFNCGVHAQRTLRQIVTNDALLRRQIPRLDEHLLQLEQVELDVLTLLQELVLIVCLLNLGVLLADISNCSLHLLLHIFGLLSRFNQPQGSFEDLFVLSATLAIRNFVLHLLSLG